MTKKLSRLEKEIIRVWGTIPASKLSPDQKEVLESFRDAIIGDDAPRRHAEKVSSLVSAVQISASLMSRTMVRYSGRLLQTYASELGRTGFKKKFKNEYEMLLGLASSTSYAVKIFRHVNAQESAAEGEHLDALAAKDTVISALQDEQSAILSADSRARRLYAKAENTLETNVADSILLYVKACDVLKEHQAEYSRWLPFQKMAKAINTRIGDAYYEIAREAEAQGKSGYLDNYRNALEYYQKSSKDNMTKSYISDCKLKLGQAAPESAPAQRGYSRGKQGGARAAPAPASAKTAQEPDKVIHTAPTAISDLISEPASPPAAVPARRKMGQTPLA